MMRTNSCAGSARRSDGVGPSCRRSAVQRLASGEGDFQGRSGLPGVASDIGKELDGASHHATRQQNPIMQRRERRSRIEEAEKSGRKGELWSAVRAVK